VKLMSRAGRSPHNSDVEADEALGRCAPSGLRSLTPVVMPTEPHGVDVLLRWVRLQKILSWSGVQRWGLSASLDAGSVVRRVVMADGRAPSQRGSKRRRSPSPADIQRSGPGQSRFRTDGPVWRSKLRVRFPDWTAHVHPKVANELPPKPDQAFASVSCLNEIWLVHHDALEEW
jgi:hypothetical protein